MRNFLICFALVAAAMLGPFVWAWWVGTRPAPPASVAAGPSDSDPHKDSSARPSEGPPDAAADLDDVDPPSANPMIDAMRRMLSDSPAFEEHGDELREQLNQADEMLAKIKAENREALDRLRKGATARRGPRQTQRGKPNLIVVDLGRLSADSLSCYNDSAEPTRVFDHLAAQGVRFEHFYRSSLDPATERARFLHASLDSSAETVPRQLLESGYESAMIGNTAFPTADPRQLGFDAWFGAKSSQLAKTAWPESIWADGAELKLVLDGGERYDSQTIYMTEAFAFAERQIGSPFFLWLSLPLPDTAYPGALGSTEAAGTSEQLGRIEQRLVEWITELNKRRISNNSIVVLTSFSAPRLRSGEDPLSERRLRAPLIVLGPGRVSAKQTSPGLATSADLGATLLQLGGAERKEPPASAGASLHSWLGQEPTVADNRTHLVWRDGDREVLVFDHWRYERRNGKTIALYDLDSSEQASKNVAGLHPQVIVKAKQWLAAAD